MASVSHQVGWVLKRRCPLRVRSGSSADSRWMSAPSHKRTFASSPDFPSRAWPGSPWRGHPSLRPRRRVLCRAAGRRNFPGSWPGRGGPAPGSSYSHAHATNVKSRLGDGRPSSTASRAGPQASDHGGDGPVSARPQYFQSYSAAQNYLLSFGHGLIESFGGSFVFASPQA